MRVSMRRLRRQPLGMTALGAALLILALSACEENKPYTPFEVATSLPKPAAPPEPPQPPPEPPPSGGPLRRALKAPRGAKTWTLGERTLSAPDGHVFELALPFGGEGPTSRTVVWTLRPARASMPASGALWLYTDGRPRRLAELPGFIPVSPDCEHTASLDQTGPNTVTLDVGARCTARLVARAPTRAVLVLDPFRDEPLLMGFRVADAAPGESLHVALDSSDLDGDGRDDVTLRVAVGAPESKKSRDVQFAWFDRAAGRSRDSREPSEGFKRAAARLAALARSKKDAPSVAGEADALRRLYASVCGESATQRLWTLEGAALTCSSDSSLAAALGAEVEAALTAGKPLEAIGALERDGWYGKKLAEKDRARLQQNVLSKVRVLEPALVGAFAAELGPLPREPHFSPLRFDEAGQLWVRNASGRVLLSDPPGSTARAPTLGAAGAANQPTSVEPWPLRATDAAGRTWTGVVPSCDRSEVQLSFVGRDGLPQPTLAVPLLAPRPGPCRRSDGRPFAVAVPIAFSTRGLEAWIGGRRLEHGLLAPALTPGAPRSPDGKTLVLPSSLGLVAVLDQRIELWRGERVRGLTACVPSTGAAHVACVRDRGVVVLKRPSPASP